MLCHQISALSCSQVPPQVSLGLSVSTWKTTPELSGRKDEKVTGLLLAGVCAMRGLEKVVVPTSKSSSASERWSPLGPPAKEPPQKLNARSLPSGEKTGSVAWKLAGSPLVVVMS